MYFGSVDVEEGFKSLVQFFGRDSQATRSLTLILKSTQTLHLFDAGFESCGPFVNETATYRFYRAAPCGLRGCKNGPAPFPGRMSYKATKPGLILFYILACFFCVDVY